SWCIFRKCFAGLAVAVGVGLGAASAATLPFGELTLEADAYGDRIALVSGSSELITVDGLSLGNANRAIGRDGANLDVVKCRDGVGCVFDVFFDGGIFNQDGDDFVISGLGTTAGVPELFDII